MENLGKKLETVPSSKFETISLIIKSIVIPFFVIAIFYQDLAIIINDALLNASTSYIIAIPFIFIYLIYRKRKMLKATIPSKNTNHTPIIVGILLSTIAMLLYWYGSYTFTPLEYHVAALPIFTFGLVLILFNPQTLRQLIFPILFLILLIPPPNEILYGLGGTLSVVSSYASYSIVNSLGIPSTLSSEYGNPTILITRPNGTTIPFSIDIACSGVYSLIGFLIFAIFIAYIIRDKIWKKGTLFLIGLPLIYLFNIIRIASILLIGYQYGEELALNVFHFLGGWILIFIGTLLLLLVSEKIFKMKIFQKPTKCPECNPKPKTQESSCLECGRIIKSRLKLTRSDVVKIATIAISIFLIMSIQAPVVTLTQSPAILIINTPSGQQTSTSILPEIPGYKLNFLYRDTNFEERANQDMALAYRYTPINHQNEPIDATIEIASTRSSLHRWEACLINYPIKLGREARVIQIELKDTQLIDNPPLIGRYFVFQYPKNNQTQAVLYWYETATFTVNSTSQQKHAKISIITYPKSTENMSSIENKLVNSAKAVANYWEPIKTWSTATMFLAFNGNQLLILPIALLAGIGIFYFYNRRKGKRMLFQAFNKLSKSNKQLLMIIHETEKNNISTLNNISDTWKKITGKPTDKRKLLHELRILEKTGTLRSVIANQNDEPKIAWITQINLK